MDVINSVNSLTLEYENGLIMWSKSQDTIFNKNKVSKNHQA